MNKWLEELQNLDFNDQIAAIKFSGALLCKPIIYPKIIKSVKIQACKPVNLSVSINPFVDRFANCSSLTPVNNKKISASDITVRNHRPWGVRWGLRGCCFDGKTVAWKLRDYDVNRQGTSADGETAQGSWSFIKKACVITSYYRLSETPEMIV